MSQSHVLVLNAGSSSLKFAIVDAQSGEETLSGIAEKLGLTNAEISWKYQSEKHSESLSAEGNPHDIAMQRIVALLQDLQLNDDFVAIGHRVVAGGESFKQTVAVDEAVIEEIEALAELAPLHNKANALAIRAAVKAYPMLPQFAVFDTAYHQTMPEKAFIYALPYELYKKEKVRRYGAHGTSHFYVAQQAAQQLGKPLSDLNAITVHLGNGASISAIKHGQSVDTSMGLTPLAGLMMGTRCGDIDPSVIEFLLTKGWSKEALFETLNKKSGFLGVSGVSSDAREIMEAVEQGHAGATLAFEVFTYRVAKYIASYLVPLDRLDAVIFTGGIGENSLPIRREILNNLKILGFVEDAQGNEAARFGQAGQIGYSTIFDAPVFVIPTNEELVIAQQSVALL